jgi:MFS family permease
MLALSVTVELLTYNVNSRILTTSSVTGGRMEAPVPRVAQPVDGLSTSSRWLAPVLLAMIASAVSQGFVRFTYAFVLPAMKDDVLGSYSAAGLLGAVNLGSYLVAVLAMTALANRFESSLLVKVGLTGCAAGMLMIAVAPGVWALVLGMALAGSMSAAVWIPVSGIVAACAPPSRRGFAYGLMIMGIGLSVAVSGLLTGVVQEAQGADAWRGVWALEAGLAGIILVIVAIGLKPVSTGPEVVLRGWRHVRTEVASVRICLAYGVYGLGFSIYVHYLIAALQELGNLSSTTANSAYSALGLTSIAGAILLGRISDRWHRSHTLGAAMAITGTCAAVVTLTTNPWVLTASVTIYGLVMTGIGVVLAAYLSDELPAPDVSTMFGVATLALATAQFLAPPAGGWLTDVTGSFTVTYLVSAAAGLTAGAVAWFLPSSRAAVRRH